MNKPCYETVVSANKDESVIQCVIVMQEPSCTSKHNPGKPETDDNKEVYDWAERSAIEAFSR